MAIDDVYQVSVRSTASSQVYMNGLAFVRTSADPVDAAMLTTLASAIKEIHRTYQAPGLTYTTWQARQVRGTNVTYPTGSDCTPEGGLFFDGLLSGSLVGSGVGELLPHQCSLVTTLRTGQIGRRKRGRFYSPGYSENDQAVGLWNPSLITAIQGQWNAFLAIYSVVAPTSGWRVGVWSVREATGCIPHPTERGHLRIDPPNEDEAFTPINGSITRGLVYTQRRRVIGVGI